ncbi:CAAX protease family protein, partial [Staphylococcus pseudintermedius]
PRKKGEDDDTPMLMDTATEGEKVETEQEVEVASTKEEK